MFLNNFSLFKKMILFADKDIKLVKLIRYSISILKNKNLYNFVRKFFFVYLNFLSK